MAGGEGFNNAAETLTISPIHAEKYVEAATEALAYAASDAAPRAIVSAPPVRDEERSRRGPRQLFDSPIGFRRPVAAEEVEPYVKLYQEPGPTGWISSRPSSTPCAAS